MKRVSMPPTILADASGTTAFQPVTPWMPIEAMTRVRVTFRMIEAQATTAKNQPDIPVEVGAAVTVDGRVVDSSEET
jgi:hypothetical protein